jgi:hypothetical protein
VAANQCQMLHPIAEYSIPPLDYNKPFGTIILAGSSR